MKLQKYTKNSLSKNNFFSINYHLTKNCNMSCKGCFAKYNKLENNLDHIKILMNIIAYANKNNIRDKKINFVGGEPTLIKELPYLVEFMNYAGFTTSIVTNGSKITQKYLNEFKIKPNWIGISIDSFNDKTNWNLGRITKKGLILDYIKKAELIKSNDIKLKVNTMVNKLNYHEDMNELIETIMPERWKLFQYLEIKGENTEFSELLSINNKQFNHFIKNHSKINKKVKIIPENNNQMKGSYLMVTPDGSLSDNVNGVLRYSDSLLNISFEDALRQIQFSEEKLVKRGGVYEW